MAKFKFKGKNYSVDLAAAQKGDLIRLQTGEVLAVEWSETLPPSILNVRELIAYAEIPVANNEPDDVE